MYLFTFLTGLPLKLEALVILVDQLQRRPAAVRVLLLNLTLPAPHPGALPAIPRGEGSERHALAPALHLLPLLQIPLLHHHLSPVPLPGSCER